MNTLCKAANQMLEVADANQYAVANQAPHGDVMAYNSAITALRIALKQEEEASAWLAERKEHWRKEREKAQATKDQDPELSAALGWPGGISDPVLDRTRLLQMVAALHLASKQALEALKFCTPKPRPADDDYAEQGWKEHNAAITALRAALAQQAEPVEPHRWEGDHNIESPFNACMHKSYCMSLKQDEPVEPVAWMCSSPELMAKGYKRFSSRCEGDWNIPVYTAPPQRKPLTEEVAALTAQRDALLEKIKAVIAAEQSEGAGRGGFVNTPPTREHQRRVAQAWQELHAAIKAVEEAK